MNIINKEIKNYTLNYNSKSYLTCEIFQYSLINFQLNKYYIFIQFFGDIISIKYNMHVYYVSLKWYFTIYIVIKHGLKLFDKERRD